MSINFFEAISANEKHLFDLNPVMCRDSCEVPYFLGMDKMAALVGYKIYYQIILAVNSQEFLWKSMFRDLYLLM